jgi:hypothetical protein
MTLKVRNSKLTGAANSALNVLMVLMLDPKVAASVRLRAAISVLEQLIKLRELNNLEQRIARLDVQRSVGRICQLSNGSFSLTFHKHNRKEGIWPCGLAPRSRWCRCPVRST